MEDTFAAKENSKTEFRKILQELSQELDRPNIKALKFLLGDKIPGAKLERVASGCDLFELLIESEMMSISFLQDLMQLIGRLDLKYKLMRFGEFPCQQNGELSSLRKLLFKMAEQMNAKMVYDAKFIEELTIKDDITDGIDVMNHFITKKPICNAQEIPEKLGCHRELVKLYYHQFNHVTDDGADISGQYRNRMSSLFPSYKSPTFPNEYFQSTKLAFEKCDGSLTLLNGTLAELHTGRYKEKPVVIKSLINSTVAQKKDLQTTVYLRHPFLLSVVKAVINDDVKLVYCMELKTNVRLTKFLQYRLASPVLVKQEELIKILYQISDALSFLHTQVKHIRGPIVHTGVTPYNILVDGFANALLGDIDIAVEIPDEATHRSVDGIEVNAYTDRYKANARRKQPSDDIFSFGIVILQVLKWRPEVLTLFGCISKLVADQLQKPIEEVTVDEIENLTLTEDFIDTNIWKSREGFGGEVGRVALRCLLHPDNRINAAQCMSTFKHILVDNCCGLWDCDDIDERCIQCHFYDISDTLKITSDSCTAESCIFYNRFCRECHYFSFRNPLHCPMHEMVYPMIGSPRNFVILMTGHDDDSNQQRAFKKDVDYVKRVVTDPRIMNIPLENLLEVGKGNIEKMSGLEEQVKNKIRGEVDFLFVYYSGHATKSGSIRMSDIQYYDDCDGDVDDGDGDEDAINVTKLRALLGCIKFKRLLILFDCCFAAGMDLTPNPVPQSCEWMMILYSSGARSFAGCNTEKGSIFTRYFVTGLQSSQKCLCEKSNGSYEHGACPALQKFRANAAMTGFIELRNLIEYMTDPRHGSVKQKPCIHFRETRLCSDKSGSVIAYYNDALVTYNFRFIDSLNKAEIPVQLEQIDHSATSLKDAVIFRLRREIGKYAPSVDITLSSDFRLESETGKEITTVEKFKSLALRNECFRVYLKQDSQVLK